MSVLERMRLNQTNKSLLYYQMLINRGQKKDIKEDKVFDDVKVSRHFDIKVIDKNKKNQDIQSAKTRLDLDRKMMMKTIEDTERNKRIVSNTSLDSIKAGFLDSIDKKKYIKDNSINFKNLPTEDQRYLFKIFMDFL